MKNKPLRKSLFSPQIAQSNIYISPSWAQHEQVVIHLSKLSQNVLLIIAPQEGGKSTFLQHLLTKETPSLQKVALNAKAHTCVEELFKQVSLAFGLIWEGISATQEALYHLQANTTGAVKTLFIDDAHLLSNEQLQALVGLVNTTAKSADQLKIVLLGEPSLELRLFSPEFTAIANGKIYTIELESWSLQDVNAFFNMSADAPLTKDQIATLFEQSAGLPGLIVREKMKAQNGLPTGKNMTKKRTLWKLHPISLGILAGLAIGGTYLIYNNVTSDEEAMLAPINAAQTAEQNWPAQSASPQKTSPAVAFHFDKIDNSDVIEDDMKQENIDATKPLSKENTHPQQDMPKVAEAPVTTHRAVQEVAQNEKAQVTEQTTVSLKEEKQIPQKPQKEKEKIAAPSLAKSSKALTPQESYLMSIDKKNYTLQLLGSSKEASIKQFVKKHSLEDTTYSFHTKRQGKDWYIVVYGNYQTADEAKLAAQNMSDSLKTSQIQPWVRDLGAVQKDIKLNQG